MIRIQKKMKKNPLMMRKLKIAKTIKKFAMKKTSPTPFR